MGYELFWTGVQIPANRVGGRKKLWFMGYLGYGLWECQLYSEFGNANHGGLTGRLDACSGVKSGPVEYLIKPWSVNITDGPVQVI